MKEDSISIVFDIIAGIIMIIIIGCVILLLPYQKAAQRDSLEKVIIDDYLENQTVPEDLKQDDTQKTSTEVQASVSDKAISPAPATSSKNYKGEIDSILVIDKINLQKAIIRGSYNDYNLERYLFVTADQSSILGTDNYVIYGHCSQTYGHSFNRLGELSIGDAFHLIQGTETYQYTVTSIQMELREHAAPLLCTGTNTVQLVSCEKNISEGFSEKRLIIVTAERNTIS